MTTTGATDIPGRSAPVNGDRLTATNMASSLDSTTPSGLATPDEGLLSGTDVKTPGLSSAPSSPRLLSRNASFTSSQGISPDLGDSEIPPIERLTVFDFLENLALPQALEKLQAGLQAQRQKVSRQREKIRQQSARAKERVDEWRKKVPPTTDERLRKYRRAVTDSVNKLNDRLTSKNVTLGEKVSFIVGVLNIFLSGYIVGAFPQYFHYWYTVQLLYFYPIRYYKYHKIGYHYFLADLCYFVNLLLFLSIWVFPQSKRLFISAFCLGYGNNAIAIAMWRNSLVFHSLDKVTTLFIHIMPCVTLHCLVHLVPPEVQAVRFPAVYAIRTSPIGSPEHYGLFSMFLWSSVPYGLWQLTYHIFISVRRREQIAAGRPTSFTWLRRSYAPTWIGKFVLSWPETLQEFVYMGIQYVYALLTMVPAPLWFWVRPASAMFLLLVFTWSVYNGAVYYIDIFGTRFQKELEQLKRDVARWQTSPELMPRTPKTPFYIQGSSEGPKDYMSAGSGNAVLPTPGEGDLNLGAAAMDLTGATDSAAVTPGIESSSHRHSESLTSIDSSFGGNGSSKEVSFGGVQVATPTAKTTGYFPDAKDGDAIKARK